MLRVGIFIEGTFIPSFEGATQRFQAMAWYMAKSGVDVTIFHCYRGWSDKTAIAQQPYRTYFIPPDRYYNDIDLLQRIIEHHQIDFVIMSEFLPILTFGWILKERIPRLKMYFEVHDIHSDLTRLSSLPLEEIKQLQILEQLAYYAADLCICFTDEDKRVVEHVLHQHEPRLVDLDMVDHPVFNEDSTSINYLGETLSPPVVQLPFGADPRRISNAGPNLSNKVLLFLGNLFHKPNRAAVEFLANVVFPEVSSASSDAKFLIVGDVPPALREKFSRPNFTFTGKVPDLNSIFRETTLALAPVYQGTGIKVKILDYCLAGLPILCSTRAARGILDDMKDALCIEDDSSQVGARIVQLLAHPQILVNLGTAAARVVKRQYWPLILKETIVIYELYLQSSRVPYPESLKSALSSIKLNSYFLNSYLNPGRFQSNSSPDFREVFVGGFGSIQKQPAFP
jgi:glycosyltransferase involved in cell wall biosynthesis